VGAGLAGRIVRDRDERGSYGSLAALERVPGVGPTLLERLRPHVRFSGTRADNIAVGTSKVSLNRASETELATLPGIGPVRARAIVENRTRHGPFRTLDDLARVPGIGPATLERLRGIVQVP
jgi:competence protein ComEA